MTPQPDSGGDPDPDPADLRAEAAEYEETVDALEELVVELRDESVRESRLEGCSTRRRQATRTSGTS